MSLFKGPTWLICVLLLMLCGGLSSLHAAPPPPRRTPAKVVRRPVIHWVKINKRKYLYLKEVAAYYNLRYARKGGTVTLTTNTKEQLVFTLNSQMCRLKRVQVSLSYPIVKYKNDLMLESTDLLQFIDCILRPGSVPKRKIKTVMLDPGHGGKDKGAVVAGIQEKNTNLIMAKRIGAILTRRGYRVLYTRKTDTALALPERSKLAAKHKPDLFISLHCNYAADAKISGIEVFVANPAGVPSFGTKTIGKDCPSTKFNATNALWAYITQTNLIKRTGATDRGVKRKQFAVIRETPAPSMLVEFGFLSNSAERLKLQNSAYLDKLAVAVCDSVDSLARALKPVTKKASPTAK